jgi:hypothetical protein
MIQGPLAGKLYLYLAPKLVDITVYCRTGF